MGTITSSIGLVSGLDIQSLVQQLMAIESRPLTILQQRKTQTQQQQTAYADLTARLLAAKASIHSLSLLTTFNARSAKSSHEDVLKVTASGTAALAQHTFRVRSLATRHQLTSAGFTDRDSTPIGAGTLTLMPTAARIDQGTPLAALDGFKGISTGVIRITDRSGASARIDLSTATTIQDILELINTQSDVEVTAEVRNDRIVISDLTGQAGNLIISDVGSGRMASELGLAGTYAPGSDALSRDNLIRLTDTVPLSQINDGLGLRRNTIGADLHFTLSSGQELDVHLSGSLRFETRLAELNDGRGVRGDADGNRIIRVTNRAGDSAEIDLSGADTLQDVANAVQSAGISVNVSLTGGKLIVTDSTNATASNLIIEDVTGYAAADLGISADVNDVAVSGKKVYRLDTIGGVIRAINFATGNNGELAAEIAGDGRSLILTDLSGGAGRLIVEASNGSGAAEDLGLLGSAAGNQIQTHQLIAGLETVLLRTLNGGSGVRTGLTTVTLNDNTAIALDFTGATTLADVLDVINESGILAARISEGGVGVIITDTSGSGIAAITGETAEDLHLSADGTSRIMGGNVRRQYVNENTLLADLRRGAGIRFGSFSITDSTGASKTVTLSEPRHITLKDVIDAINNLDLNVEAGINDDGDGIKLVDTGGGGGTLSVREVGSSGSTAADLGIVGTADGTVQSGTFATVIELDADDTLNDLVSKINEASAGVVASIVNDGTDFAPYRLTLTSTLSGKDGMLTFDTGRTGISFATLTEARDAVVQFGESETGNAITVTSSSNVITDAVPGLTLELLRVSDAPVKVEVSTNIDSVVAEMQRFVTSYNTAISRMDELTDFDLETQQRGVLLGDNTVNRVRDRLYSLLLSRSSDSRLAFKSFYELGLTVGNRNAVQFDGETVPSDIAHLHLDEDRLRDALARDFEGVKDFFTLLDRNEKGEIVKVGLGSRLDDVFDDITNSIDGLLRRQSDTLQNRVNLLDNRIADLQELLEIKEARLYAQFQAMESALANLQSQQSSLSLLANLASSVSSQYGSGG